MRLQNPGTETVNVAGLSIPAGRIGEVGGRAYMSWLHRSPSNPATAAKLRTLPDDPVVVAARECRVFTRDDKPTCAALSRAIGRTVSAAQRDEAGGWARARA